MTQNKNTDVLQPKKEDLYIKAYRTKPIATNYHPNEKLVTGL